MTLLVAVLLFALPLCAQDDEGMAVVNPLAAKGHQAIPQGSVSGQVIYTDTHAPARGARVLLMPLAELSGEGSGGSGQSLSTATALDGSYLVPHVPPGEYMVAVLAPGYLSPLDGIRMKTQKSKDNAEAEAAMRKSGAMVRVSSQEGERKDIELVRGATFSGKVLYSDGQPSSQAKVFLQRVDDAAVKDDKMIDAGAMIRLMLQQQQLRTDDQGNFRVSGVPPGKYRLAVVQMVSTAGLMEEMMAAMGQGKKTPTDLTIYSGNTIHQKSATSYEVGPGDVRDGLQVMLPLGGLHTLSGKVTSKDGKTLDAAALELTDTSDAAIQFQARVKGGGEFQFAGVPEGTYELKIHGGMIFENPPQFELSDEQMEQLATMFKPTHAYAELQESIIVKDANQQDLSLVLNETDLPKPPVGQAAGARQYHTVGPN